MSIIKNAAADSFIERLPRGVQFYLVHGPDEGLTHERSQAIVRKVLGENPDPLRLVRLEGDGLARDPGALAEEAYAVSMFGGARAIWIDAKGRELFAAVNPLFARPPDDCAIIIKCGQIKKGNELRSAFETMLGAVSIECYPDKLNALGPLIDGELQNAGIALAPEARTAVLAMLGADRTASRSEITKLMLFAQGKRRIEDTDVAAVLSGSAQSGIDDIIDRSLVGDLRGAAECAARFFNEGGDGDYLINRLIARLTLLFRIRVEMDQGRTFDAACQALSITLPADVRRSLAQQAECWSSQSVTKRLAALRDASVNVRNESRLSGILAARGIWALASRSPSRRD